MQKYQVKLKRRFNKTLQLLYKGKKQPYMASRSGEAERQGYQLVIISAKTKADADKEAEKRLKNTIYEKYDWKTEVMTVRVK